MVEKEGSTFGKPLSRLNSVCWLEVWLNVEHIPKTWGKITVSFMGIFERSYNLDGAKVKISAVKQSECKE